MRKLLRANFVAAVRLCIGFNLYVFWGYMPHLLQQRFWYIPFAARVALAPLGWAFSELVLWFRYYRFEGPLARLLAGTMGVMLGLFVIVQLLRASIDLEIGVSDTWLFVYFATSHLAYALLGPRANAGAG